MSGNNKGGNTTKGNIKSLQGFRVSGKHVADGEVVSKNDFHNKADWQNLCNMTPPRAEETADAVTPEAKTALGKAKKPAKVETKGMPGSNADK